MQNTGRKKCASLADLLQSVYDFITVHPREVVLIDINRFYEFHEKEHEELLEMIRMIFGEKLVNRPATARAALSYTLNKIWSIGRVSLPIIRHIRKRVIM